MKKKSVKLIKEDTYNIYILKKGIRPRMTYYVTEVNRLHDTHHAPYKYNSLQSSDELRFIEKKSAVIGYFRKISQHALVLIGFEKEDGFPCYWRIDQHRKAFTNRFAEPSASTKASDWRRSVTRTRKGP